MRITMLADFKQYKKGETVVAPQDSAEWLISRRYADPAAPESDQPAAAPSKPSGRKK